VSELAAVRCTGCGGTVRALVGLPRCLFCGREQLVPTVVPEGIEAPVGHLPFEVDEAAARATFRAFAASSWWYPDDLRRARVDLRRLQLPAWAWSGELETHWTGQVHAPERRADKRPVSGVARGRVAQVLVPASTALRLAELASLGRYDEARLVPEVPDDDPTEVSALTRSAARARAQEEMVRRHAAAISEAEGLVEIRASSLATGLEGRPMLVPVWIGAFRYGRRTFRILVNGQTGRLVGDAPISVWKVIGVAAAVVVVLGTIAGVLLAVAAA
jgi:hypothetical protein